MDFLHLQYRQYTLLGRLLQSRLGPTFGEDQADRGLWMPPWCWRSQNPKKLLVLTARLQRQLQQSCNIEVGRYQVFLICGFTEVSIIRGWAEDLFHASNATQIITLYLETYYITSFNPRGPL